MSVITELWDDAQFIIQFRRNKTRIQKELDRQAPKPGDVAPDFTLTDVSGKETISLSDFRGKKPVALVFGSYT